MVIQLESSSAREASCRAYSIGDPVLVQEFDAKLADEAFHAGVLNGLSGLDEVQPNVVAVGPRLADQLRSIIDDDGSGRGQFETGLSQ